MNARRYLDSRMGRTIERIKTAYLSGRHIIFLVCNEPDFVKSIIAQNSILPYKQDKVGAIQSCNKINENTGWGDKPHTILCELDTNFLNKDFSFYVNVCHSYGLNSGTTIQRNISNNVLKDVVSQSLIVVPVPSEPSVPEVIQGYCEVVRVPSFSESEFSEIVSSLIHILDGESLDENGLIEDKVFLHKMFLSMRGMGRMHIETTLRKIKIECGQIYSKEEFLRRNALKQIRNEVNSVISSSGALSMVETEDGNREPDCPAGMDALLDWMQRHHKRISDIDYQVDYHLSEPRGILISGIPGSGKSMLAKYIAYFLTLPLLRFDLGDVLGGLVGESEKNMNQALKTIEDMSPCVLWVDEMDKAFANMSGNNVHETSKRLFGKFLTWMQERKSSCFVYATANDISAFPPEIFRSGRFDEKFYTFLPSADDCANIFETNLLNQIKRYEGMFKENSQRKDLYDRQSINGIWFKNSILENETICFPDRMKRADTHMSRRNKFFIGSDITNIIENAKVLYLERCKKNDPKYIYETNSFKQCIIDAVKMARTYGETNMTDIAVCFAHVAENNFSPVSKNVIVPLEGYDESAMYEQDSSSKLLYNNREEDSVLAKLGGLYDKQLYLATRNAVNKMKEEIFRRMHK